MSRLSEQNRVKNLTERAQNRLEEEALSLLDGNALLQERFDEMTRTIMSLQNEDIGWQPINSLNKDDGFSLENIQDIAKKAEIQTTGNPLLKRGLSLRTNNVFGRGLTFDYDDERNGLPPRFQKILDKPRNKNAVYSQRAFTHNERALFTTGNLIMAYRRSTSTFFPIPFKEITNTASNPDLAEDVWYYQRTYIKTAIDGSPTTESTVEWYPVLETYEESGLPASIQDEPVVADVVIIDMKVNGRVGGVYGVPDVLPALPWAWAHGEYLRDGSKLLKALATIAWKVVNKSKAGANNSSAKMAQAKAAGSTVSMTEGTDMVSMPRAGAVDLNDGSAMAGYVASALEVSKISILSDPGASGGSYGAAATLAPLEANAARARQNLWSDWYRRLFRAMGYTKTVTPNWPKLSEDALYRQMQTLSLAHSTGALFQDEYRRAVLELTDAPRLHSDLPKPNVFNNAAAYTAQAKAAAAIDAPSDPNPSQGNSGAVGSIGNDDSDLRNGDSTPGTNS